MADETTIDDFVPDVVEEAAYDITAPLLPELTLIYADQNHDSPPLPYATIEIIGRRNVGMPTIGGIDDDGVQTYEQTKEGSMSVAFFGGTARRHADNLVSRFSKQTSRDLMRSRRFFTTGQPAIIPINRTRQGVYIEPGAIVDVNWRYTAKFYDEVGIIERVNCSGEIAADDFEFEIDVKYIEE